MPTVKTTKRAVSARQKEAMERRTQWRQLAAAAIAKRHPSWSILQVADAIQRSPASNKRGGPMRYSVSNIVSHIRGAW